MALGGHDRRRQNEIAYNIPATRNSLPAAVEVMTVITAQFNFVFKCLEVVIKLYVEVVIVSYHCIFPYSPYFSAFWFMAKYLKDYS